MAVTLFALAHKSPVQGIVVPRAASPVATVAPRAATPGVPSRLKITALNIDAAVEGLGLNSVGEMDTPKGPDDVAWYKFGQRPGFTGSAVIAGHSNWYNGAPAVFDNLNKLNAGDKIIVVGDNGLTITFVVRELRDYDQNRNAASVFGSNDGRAHLNLITCEGVWNKVTHSFSKRLVVFADQE